MIKWLVGALLSPLTKLGERYLDNQKDKNRLEAGITTAAHKADSSIRKVKLGHWMGRTPLFIMEVACATYVGAILFDSTYPTIYINPLELPEWFKPHFTTVLASVAGLATVERIFGRKK